MSFYQDDVGGRRLSEKRGSVDVFKQNEDFYNNLPHNVTLRFPGSVDGDQNDENLRSSGNFKSH